MATWQRILMDKQVQHGDNTSTQNWGTGLSLSATGSFNGDICKIGTAPVTTVSGKVYALVGGTWILADKDTVAHGKALLGVSTGSAISSSFPTNGFLIKGLVRVNAGPLNSPTVGDVIFMGDSGDTDGSAPTGVGDIVRPLGYWVHNTNKTMLFDPDKTWVELV